MNLDFFSGAFAALQLKSSTPPKFNMEPENEPLEEEIPMKNHHF